MLRPHLCLSTLLVAPASAIPSIYPRSTPSPLNLGIPSALPANVSQALDPCLISSIETAFINQFLGNKSDPNALTLQLIFNIVNRTDSVALR